MTDLASPESPTAPVPGRRKPRKIFLLIGVAVAVALGIGLFSTSSSPKSSTGAPQVGAAVPSFSASNLNGAGTVSVAADRRRHGSPTVLLFFGNWCPSCHQELPPLAAAVKRQQAAGGALASIRVVGVDSEDHAGEAKDFIKSSGVTFPVAYDPGADIISGDFYFEGDPYAVFIKGDGTIARIVRGDVLTPSLLTTYEKALIPNGK